MRSAGLFLVPCMTLCLGLATPAASAATPLPAAKVLNKLSLTTRGRLPSRAELAAFERDAAATEASFFSAYRQQVDIFLSDPAFATAVDAYHQLWWHQPKAESTALASYIVVNDRPYDEIFAKDYLYIDGAHVNDYGAVMPMVATPLPKDGEPYQRLRLAANEPRFRSVFSNLDFLSRFPDTPTNSNRKRANYVFRTFLCENLANVLLPGVEIPKTGPHGTNPECQGCHTRLDPMARFFDRWPPISGPFSQPYYEPAQAARGAVVVKGPDGQAQAYAGTADADLGAVLKALPGVQQCIVQKIWEFAAGPNTRLPGPAAAELLATFRRTNSFKQTLKQALLHPYLWTSETPSPLNFVDIGPSLQVCATCHSAGIAPEFGVKTYPFRADPAENKALLLRIFGAASGNPVFVRMPPGTQPPLPSESVAKLRDWIGAGALDEHLQPSLTPSDSKEILDE